jgi:hypothetical protein
MLFNVGIYVIEQLNTKVYKQFIEQIIFNTIYVPVCVEHCQKIHKDTHEAKISFSKGTDTAKCNYRHHLEMININ